MVFSVYNCSDNPIKCRTANAAHWQTVVPNCTTKYYLRDTSGSPDNLVLVASEHGLFYGHISEGHTVQVLPGNRVVYHSAITDTSREDYFAEYVYASDLVEYEACHPELVFMVNSLSGYLVIEED